MDIPQRKTMVTSVNLSVRAREQPQVRPRSPEAPFRILLLGNFSGDASSTAMSRTEPESQAVTWRPRRIDIDNWEEVMRRLGPKLQLPVGDPQTEITFQSIDDFHPDALFAQLPLFQQLRQWRRQLKQSSTFTEAARQVRAWAKQEGGGPPPREAGSAAPDSQPEEEGTDEPPQGAPPSGASLLDDLLSRPVSEHARTPSFSLPDRQLAESWEAALKKMVLPYCVDDVSADRDQLVATVDAAAEKLMRMLLHDPAFQHLEGLWRGVEWFLKEEVEEDSPLEIYLVDCSWEALQITLADAEQEEQQEASNGTAGRRLASLFFPEPGTDPGPPRWQLVLGLFSVGSGEQDAASLERLGRWLSCAQVPLAAQADASHVGYAEGDTPGGRDDWPELSDAVADRWEAVRANAHMRWIGLIWPRFLLRLPYGRRTQPCESLGLEERGPEWRHTDYLWGNSALLWGAAVARHVAREEGSPFGSDVIEFGGMPLDIYPEEGELVAHPCTETLLGERDIAALLARGIMPALAVRGSDSIRLTSFRSLTGETLVQFTS